MAPSLLLLLGWFCGVAVVEVHASGTVEVYLTRYSTNGKDANGELCDTNFFGKTSDCDFYFDLKLGTTGRGAKDLNHYTTSDYAYENYNNINFGSKFGNHWNPLSGTTSSSFGGYMYFYMAVNDADSWTEDDYVDTINSYVQLKNDNAYYQKTLRGAKGTTINFLYRFRCHQNYHNSLCTQFCEPQNTDAYGHYLCDSNGNKICHNGYFDLSVNCKKVDRCASNPCSNGGTCKRGTSSGAFTCQCTTQYEGTQCERIRDPCTYKNRCVNRGVCYANGHNALCRCPSNYEGATCDQDVNECLPNNPCKGETSCTNTIGSYTCNCPASLTGKHCELDVNECALSNTCQHEGICTNNHGGFKCYCKDSWTGKNCEQDRDECTNPLVSWDGKGACLNGGTCTNTIGDFTCQCPSSYEGSRCEKNRCSSITCLNDAECKVDGTSGPVCVCKPGFSGVYCGTEVDECKVSTPPCKNNGKCTDLYGVGYHCECLAGFDGDHCEIDVNDCVDEPCANGGTCTDKVNGFTCTCPTGFDGSLCQNNIEDCQVNSCKNNGTCMDQINGFFCACKSGFTGQQCETNVNDCKTDSCLNEAECEDLVGGFHCRCKPGYTGQYCHDKVDHCIDNRCSNGATCMNQINNYRCICPRKYHGEFCAELVDNCVPQPCLNNATCKTTFNSERYECHCKTGFTGRYCQNEGQETAAKQVSVDYKAAPLVPMYIAGVILLVIIIALVICILLYKKGYLGIKKKASGELGETLNNPNYAIHNELRDDDADSCYETIIDEHSEEQHVVSDDDVNLAFGNSTYGVGPRQNSNRTAPLFVPPPSVSVHQLTMDEPGETSDEVVRVPPQDYEDVQFSGPAEIPASPQPGPEEQASPYDFAFNNSAYDNGPQLVVETAFKNDTYDNGPAETSPSLPIVEAEASPEDEFAFNNDAYEDDSQPPAPPPRLEELDVTAISGSVTYNNNDDNTLLF